MTVEVSGLRITRHADGDTRWEMATRPPHPRLAAYVLGYTGYVERTRLTLRRRELPFAGVPLIISFGPTIRVAGPRQPAGWTPYRSFIAGLDDRHVITEYAGAQHGVQVNFTPLGAYRFLGLSMRSLTNRVVHLDDLLGADADRIAAQLQELAGWEERFAMLDRVIGARIAASRAPSTGIAWAWRRIQATGGNIGIAALARELGCSRKHLIVRFHDEIGLSPKLVARIQRFNRVRQMLERRTDLGWAEIADRCGYYDQAHFNRDFRQFAGCAPGELLRRRLPNGGGIGA
jgi:AraC-like DNA-binding protein